jgi:hypothetical protein
MQNNDKIQSFFSEQLRELKATYSNKICGKVYTATDKEKALNRCLELADFGVCVDDIQPDLIRCKCDKEVFGYVCVNPETKFFFVVGVCKVSDGLQGLGARPSLPAVTSSQRTQSTRPTKAMQVRAERPSHANWKPSVSM